MFAEAMLKCGVVRAFKNTKERSLVRRVAGE